jgi:dehydro coenzyme F420 reductase / coenzyme F420-0:L-glutamate ligase / coenzyme F420-1:gamma-L-glutamate ligase
MADPGAAEHYYRDCTDDDCRAGPCMFYKEGQRDGYARGYDAGYADGEAAGYVDGYSQQSHE